MKRYKWYIGIGLGIVLVGAAVVSQQRMTEKRPAEAQELLQQDIRELVAYMPQANALLVASLNVPPFTQPQALAMGQEFTKSYMKENIPNITDEELEEQLTAFEALLKSQQARRSANQEKEHMYYAQANKAWRRKLPTHQSNLTFLGPNGEKPVSHEKIPCPRNLEDVKDKTMTCYEYVYSEGQKSIFYFDDDLLAERDDVFHHHATQRFRLPIMPFYTERDKPQMAGAVEGTIFMAYYFDKDYPLPVQELVYGYDGVLSSAISRDFKLNRQAELGYDSDHRFYSYYETHPIPDLPELNSLNKHTQTLLIELNWPLVHTEDSPKTYTLTYNDNGRISQHTGRWTEGEDQTVTLDNNMQFSPVEKSSKAQAPRYCTLYPKGCRKK